MKFSQNEILKLWNELEDVTFVENSSKELILNSDWFLFKKNTSQNEIWSWFAQNFKGGIYSLLENN